MSDIHAHYPYLEPCLGCFENDLRELSERSGSPIFFGNGDLSMNRFLLALCKLVPGADFTICCYSLLPSTMVYLADLRKAHDLGEITVFCNSYTDLDDFKKEKFASIHVIKADVNFFLLQATNASSSMTLTGVFMQDYPSRRLDLYTLHNDPAEQSLIRKTIYQAFHKPLNHVRKQP